MDSGLVCERLLRAESEEEVGEIISGTPEMRDAANWSPLDGRESNFNIVTNQASTGGKAATELMTNMVDAILLKRAHQQGIDPKDPAQAPRNMHEAVDRLVLNLRGGKLVNAPENWLKEFAERNLVVAITGHPDSTRVTSDRWPCYTFVDNGEGQHPGAFRDTFLSLSAKHKSEIPFVQGKYNMGSSGVLAYCGRRWHKLIVSRRHDRSGEWGWTLIRRRPGKGAPVADYFHAGGDIPSFSLDMLYPVRTGDGSAHEDVAISAGTVVKLYDFRVGKRHKDTKDARYAFNENLTETILPFRILDFRWRPVPGRKDFRRMGIDERPFYGMEYHLRRGADGQADGGDGTEDGQPDGQAAIAERFGVGAIDDPDLGRVEAYAIPIRARPDGRNPLPEWLRPAYSNNRVFHTVNGQVLYKQTRGYLSNKCNLSVLKDRVVIVVDASRLNESAHFSLWKGDRENIIQNATGEAYLSTVLELIKGSPGLDDWKQTVAREDLERVATKDTDDLFRKLVKSNRDLGALLDPKNPKISVPRPPKEPEVYRGNYDPTFLEIDRPLPLEIPINRAGGFVARTDAVDDFFDRPDNRGRLVYSDPGFPERFSVRYSLHHGSLRVTVKPRSASLRVGDLFDLSIGLVSDSMPMEISRPISVRLAPQAEAPAPQPSKPSKPRDKTAMRGLPRLVLLTRDGRKIGGEPTNPWPEGYSELDGGRMGEDRDNPTIEVNVDNVHRKRYCMRAKTKATKDLLTQKYITGMRLFLLCLERARRNYLAQSEGDEDSERFAEIEDVFSRVAARGAAMVTLWLADQLPKAATEPDDVVE